MESMKYCLSPHGLLEMLNVVLLKSMESPQSPHGLHGDSWRVPMESPWSLWEHVGECKVLLIFGDWHVSTFQCFAYPQSSSPQKAFQTFSSISHSKSNSVLLRWMRFIYYTTGVLAFQSPSCRSSTFGPAVPLML